jgi:hypothetical protein
MMSCTQQPSREAFVAYWKGFEVYSWRNLVPYAVYLGGLALYVFVIHRIDSEARFWIPSLIIAGAYLVFLPYFWIRRIHTRYARFIRCPECGDWFGQDSSGAYRGPNPKFRTVILTGRCGKCGVWRANG